MMKNLKQWMLGLGTCLTITAGIGGSATAQPEPIPDALPLTLSLKYVQYKNSAGAPVLSRPETDKVVDSINRIYSPCHLQFRIEDYQEVVPETLGLKYGLDHLHQLDDVRGKFPSTDKLLVVNTGNWNHNRVGSPNAWTAMPGESLLGAIVEASVASFAGIVAHELGHYLSLDHYSNTANLMNPIIYEDSVYLSSDQCSAMRATAKTVFMTALR